MSHTPAQLAEASFMEGDGQEIAAIVVASVAARAERECQPLTIGQTCIAGTEPLMAAIWSLVKMAHDDDASARLYLAGYLRDVADRVEALPPG